MFDVCTFLSPPVELIWWAHIQHFPSIYGHSVSLSLCLSRLDQNSYIKMFIFFSRAPSPPPPSWIFGDMARYQGFDIKIDFPTLKILSFFVSIYYRTACLYFTIGAKEAIRCEYGLKSHEFPVAKISCSTVIKLPLNLSPQALVSLFPGGRLIDLASLPLM